MRICDVTIKFLRDNDFPFVMWGDTRNLHAIAELAGWESEGSKTEKRVLAALSRTPGDLVKSRVYSITGRGNAVLMFRLPECR